MRGELSIYRVEMTLDMMVSSPPRSPPLNALNRQAAGNATWAILTRYHVMPATLQNGC